MQLANIVVEFDRQGRLIKGPPCIDLDQDVKKAYDPDEPRDDQGQWTSGGAAPYDETNTRGDMPPEPTIRSANDVRQWGGSTLDLAGDAEARNEYYKQTSAASPINRKYSYEVVDGAQNAAARQIAERTNLSLGVVRDLQHGWIGDGKNVQATALVQAATEQFHLANNAAHLERMMQLDEDFAAGGQVGGPATGNSYPDREAFLQQARDYLKAQYAYTQEQLAKQGYKPDDTVTLYRGITRAPTGTEFSTATARAWSPVAAEGRALSSWTVDFSQAARFGSVPTHSPADEIRAEKNNGYVMATQVKIKDILATGYTGLGQGTEHEVVVLNGYRPVWARRIE